MSRQIAELKSNHSMHLSPHKDITQPPSHDSCNSMEDKHILAPVTQLQHSNCTPLLVGQQLPFNPNVLHFSLAEQVADDVAFLDPSVFSS